MQFLSKLSVSVNIILVLVCVVFFQHWFYQNRGNNEKITEAQQANKALSQKNEELQDRVKELDAGRQNLEAKLADKESSISGLRAEIDKINKEYELVRASSFRIRTDDASVENFKRVFEKFAEQVQTVSVEKTKVSPVSGKEVKTDIVYMMMPVAYVDHFVRSEEERKKLTEENVRLGEVDRLNEEIKKLNREILSYEEQKAQEFKKGYDLAYEMFQRTNEEYLKTLKGNRNDNLLKMLGSAAAGIALGVNF